MAPTDYLLVFACTCFRTTKIMAKQWSLPLCRGADASGTLSATCLYLADVARSLWRLTVTVMTPASPATDVSPSWAPSATDYFQRMAASLGPHSPMSVLRTSYPFASIYLRPAQPITSTSTTPWCPCSPSCWGDNPLNPLLPLPKTPGRSHKAPISTRTTTLEQELHASCSLLVIFPPLVPPANLPGKTKSTRPSCAFLRA